MKFKIYLILLAFPFFACNIYAQELEADLEPIKNDLSINVTALLGNVLSINDDDTGVPYAISYRRINNNWAIRLSLAGGLDKSSSSEQGVFSSLEKKETEIRLGFEKIHSLSSVFDMTFGIDFTGSYITENSNVSTFNGSFSQEEKKWLAGGGPAIRFMYKLNRRVSFHTESTLYFKIGQTEIDNINSTIPNRTEDLYMLDLAMPQALFITIGF